MELICENSVENNICTPPYRLLPGHQYRWSVGTVTASAETASKEWSFTVMHGNITVQYAVSDALTAYTASINTGALTVRGANVNALVRSELTGNSLPMVMHSIGSPLRLSSAALHVHSRDTATPFTDLQLWTLDHANWNSTSLTLANQPTAVAQIAQVAVVNAGTWYSLDLTTALSGFTGRESRYPVGFVFRSSSSNSGQTMDSLTSSS